MSDPTVVDAFGRPIDPSYNSERLGRALKVGLAEQGMTQADLSRAIGVSRCTVSNWATGQGGMSLESAVKCCDVFGWPLDRLVGRGEWRE